MRRIDSVRSCGLADEIIVEEREGQKISDIQKYDVDIIVFGSDWRGKCDYLTEYCEVVYLDRTKDISSSNLRDVRHGIVQLGIVGTGKIAGRTMEEIIYVSGVNVVAVYNPRTRSAKQFAKEHELAYSFDNYDSFLEKVNAVYIASPHDTHYDYTRRALVAGKHVLCEKPIVLSEAEARELFELAERSNLVLMEAIKTAYAPGFLNLLAIAKGGRLGKIHDIEAAFTKLVPSTPGTREYDSKVGGSFTELASYSLLPIIKILGTNYTDVRFDFFNDKNGVDIYAKAHFRYNGSDDCLACAKTGIGVKSEGQLLISGTSGYILVKSPWWLLKTFQVCYENPDENESFSAPFPGYGMRYEVADFIKNITESAARNYKLTREDSIAIAGVIERFLKARNS